MKETIRLVCPECGRPADSRIKELEAGIAEWVLDADFRRLLRCFDIDIPADIPLREYTEKLREELQIWDFRKGQERWNSRADDPRIEANGDLIEHVCRRLGLLDISEPVIQDPDHILPLGGARMTNYIMPLKARTLIEEHGWDGVCVTGLSTFRPAAERDRPYFEGYAPGAETEFGAMCGGLRKVFGLTDSFTSRRKEEENTFLCSETRIYDQSFRGGRIASLAAPSSEPAKRRANTLDTFMYFLDEFGIAEGSRIIFTTSCLYVPFQLMKLMKAALERDLMIDCVCAEAREHIAPGDHSRYLQEIKATVDAICGLYSPDL